MTHQSTGPAGGSSMMNEQPCLSPTQSHDSWWFNGRIFCCCSTQRSPSEPLCGRFPCSSPTPPRCFILKACISFCMQSCWRGMVARARAKLLRTRRDAATAIQAAVRGMLGRKYAKQYERYGIDACNINNNQGMMLRHARGSVSLDTQEICVH